MLTQRSLEQLRVNYVIVTEQGATTPNTYHARPKLQYTGLVYYYQAKGGQINIQEIFK